MVAVPGAARVSGACKRSAASRRHGCGLRQIFRLRFGFRVRRQACRWLRSSEGSVASVLDGGRLLFSLGNAAWYSAGLSSVSFFAWRRRTREASRELRCRYLELRFLWSLRKILVWLCGKLGEEPGYGFLCLRNGAPLRKRAGISEAWNFGLWRILGGSCAP